MTGTTPLSPAETEATARAAHTGRTDKAGRPYAEHLRAVAEGVRARGGDEEQIAAAWLHDAVEDDGLSQRWLEEAVPTRRTKGVVLAVTGRSGEPPEAVALDGLPRVFDRHQRDRQVLGVVEERVALPAGRRRPVAARALRAGLGPPGAGDCAGGAAFCGCRTVAASSSPTLPAGGPGVDR